MSHLLQLDTRFSTIQDSATLLAERAREYAKTALPAFQQHSFDISALGQTLEPYQRYRNIIIISNGGSRTSSLAYRQALAHRVNEKNVEFVSTMEPDVVAALKKKYAPEDTLVMPISKSGTNVDVLEPLLQFLEYRILPVTSPEKGVLYDIATHYGWDIISHPEVGGRFSGRTECGFAPAILMGLDAEKINAGAVAAYDIYDFHAPSETNIALQAAATCFELEQQGIDEIFMPMYSHGLSGFLPLIVQLLHESTGKDGKGQTIFGDEAPESQHHTNQRFFGGKKNVMGWFVTLAEQQHSTITTRVPDEIKQLPLREGTLADINGVPLQDALRFDYEGVAEQATTLGIPHITLTVPQLNEECVGGLLSFFQYFTVYSALVRGQNPFDQPAVEAAKAASFKKRQDYIK